MSSIAIIVARGGSKRIPKKNIKVFCGKPILAYSIEAALESECFDEIMVSTDSEEIADVALHYGATVHFYRSSVSASDHATTSDALLEVLSEYLNRGQKFVYGGCIYPTAPFLNGEKIKQGMFKLQHSDADTIIPLVAFSYPPQRGFIHRGERFVMKQPEYVNARSQDLEKIYHDCGQFYCFRTESFIRNKNLLTGTIDGIVIPEMEVQDIDTPEDWAIAELKYQYVSKQ